MKLHVYKDLVTQISYFEFQPDSASFGGGAVRGTGNLRKYLKRREQDGKNKNLSKIYD